MKTDKTSTPRRGAGLVAGTSQDPPPVSLAADALDDRIAIVGTAGSGKTYAAKGFVERLLEQELAAARARIAVLEEDNRELKSRLTEISALAASAVRAPAVDPVVPAFAPTKGPRSRILKPERPLRVVASDAPEASATSIHPAARKLLTALVQHAPARFTWGQTATLAGLKPSGGHFNSGRKACGRRVMLPRRAVW
jgi:hypothetical protein